jgi:hypothetical protein
LNKDYACYSKSNGSSRADLTICEGKTLDVTAAEAATLVLPFAATIPEGVTCYTLTHTDGASSVVATEVTGGTLAAETPVLVNATMGSYKFRNSEIIVRYLLAVDQQGLPLDEDDEYALPVAYKMLSRIFIERDEDNKSYQFMFNEVYSATEAEEKLQQWLKEFGYHSAERSEISERAHSEAITEILDQNNDIVVNQIHAKGIPTMIYNNRKHTGKFETK